MDRLEGRAVMGTQCARPPSITIHRTVCCSPKAHGPNPSPLLSRLHRPATLFPKLHSKPVQMLKDEEGGGAGGAEPMAAGEEPPAAGGEGAAGTEGAAAAGEGEGGDGAAPMES